MGGHCFPIERQGIPRPETDSRRRSARASTIARLVATGVGIAAATWTASAIADDLAGLGLGIGLSLTQDVGSRGRVQSASIEKGIVRVSSEQNSVPRAVLESHYFYNKASDPSFLVCPPIVTSNYCGLFVAAAVGTTGVDTASLSVTGVGLGWMYGFGDNTKDKGTWNLGLGMFVDPQTKVLGDGFRPNEEPDNGADQVRFKTTDQWGLMIIFSRGF